MAITADIFTREFVRTGLPSNVSVWDIWGPTSSAWNLIQKLCWGDVEGLLPLLPPHGFHVLEQSSVLPWMVLLRLKNVAKLIPVQLRKRTTVPSCYFLKIPSLNWAIRIKGGWVELKILRWFKVDHRGRLCSTRKKWGSTHHHSLDTEVSSQIMPHLIHRRLLPYIWLWLPSWVLTCSF